MSDTESNMAILLRSYLLVQPCLSSFQWSGMKTKQWKHHRSSEALLTWWITNYGTQHGIAKRSWIQIPPQLHHHISCIRNFDLYSASVPKLPFHLL